LSDIQKIQNLRLLAENESVSLSAFSGVSVGEIKAVAGESDAGLAFLVSLVDHRTLGLGIVFVIKICVVGKGISRRKHNFLRLALSLGTGVVLAVDQGQGR